MKKTMWLAILGLLMAVPSWLAAQEGGGNYDHGSVAIFADYFRFSPAASTTNFIGFGGAAEHGAGGQAAGEFRIALCNFVSREWAGD